MAPVKETCPTLAHSVNKFGVKAEEQDKITRSPLCENVTSNGLSKHKMTSVASNEDSPVVFCSPGYNNNKENKFYLPKISHSSDESKACPSTSSSSSLSSSSSSSSMSHLSIECPATPEKKWGSTDTEPPLTPTANLKMLSCAVSPELRRRDLMQEEKSNRHAVSQCDYSQPESPHRLLKESNFIQDADPGKIFTAGSRKEKSLGLLCQKFLAKYPNYPDPSAGIDISLDEVAQDLSVGRRRIYDIVNVLESVEIVSRVAKNKYAWHGKTNLCTTLAKLKALAEQEGFQEQMNRLKEYELKKDLVNKSSSSSSSSSSPANDLDKLLNSEQDISNLSNIPKFLEKSLGIMSQKFLMLFLVLKPKTVNLDLAAKILIGNMAVDKTENSKFKTKIRRLYDIANILTSLGLIRKIHVTEIRGRKPAFKYIGPEVDSSADISTCSTDGCHRPSSRHSLLDCVKNKKIANILNNKSSKVGQLGGNILPSQDDLYCQGSATPKESFSRHSSFDSICEVAEKERTKLISQPSTPLKDGKAERSQSTVQQTKENNPHIILVQKGNEFCGYHVLPKNGHSAPVSNSVNTPCNGKLAVASTAVSEPNTSVAAYTAAPTNVSKSSQISSVAPLTQMVSPTIDCSRSLIKHSVNNNLTPKQVEAVLKSLKDPVPVNNPSLPISFVDASTQSSPSSDPSEKLVISEGFQPVEIPSDQPLSKRRRVQDSQSDGSESGDSRKSPSGGSESGKRQSPIRALHLDPEFQSASCASNNSSVAAATTTAEKDDLAIPLTPILDAEEKSFRPVMSGSTTASASTSKGACSCNCCMNKHSNVQPTTPKLMHISSQQSSVMQLPLLAVASVTASPAGVTNSFAYANTDMNAVNLANLPARAMKVHQLSPHIVMPVAFTSSPVSAISENPQSSPTLVAFPVSQPTMTLAPMQLLQSSSNGSNNNTNSNSHLKTPTPITIHNNQVTPSSQIFFQSPCTLFDDYTFATPSSFFRNTPNPNIDPSSSQVGLMSDLKRFKPQVLMLEKQQICNSTAARRLNLIESP
ncbi:transcription factor E2F8-like [Argonauta hians]